MDKVIYYFVVSTMLMAVVSVPVIVWSNYKSPDKQKQKADNEACVKYADFVADSCVTGVADIGFSEPEKQYAAGVCLATKKDAKSGCNDTESFKKDINGIDGTFCEKVSKYAVLKMYRNCRSVGKRYPSGYLDDCFKWTSSTARFLLFGVCQDYDRDHDHGNANGNDSNL